MKETLKALGSLWKVQGERTSVTKIQRRLKPGKLMEGT